MKGNFEDPIQFNIKKDIGNIEIIYSELMEICQGGPEVGHLSINGKKVDGLFGGPCLYDNDYLYIPIYVKKFLGTGFRLVRININNNNIEYLSKVKKIIFLEKVEGNKVYYYGDIYKTMTNIETIK